MDATENNYAYSFRLLRVLSTSIHYLRFSVAIMPTDMI